MSRSRLIYHTASANRSQSIHDDAIDAESRQTVGFRYCPDRPAELLTYNPVRHSGLVLTSAGPAARGPYRSELHIVMDVLDSPVRTDDPEFHENRDADAAASWPSCASGSTARAAGRRRAYLQRHREQGKLPVRERIDRLLDPGSPLPRALAAGRVGHVRRRRARRRPRHRHRPRLRPRGRHRRQRRHGQGRHLLPASPSRSTCARSRSRSRTGCRASTSSTPAAPSCRCRPRSFPTGSTSAASSSTRRACRPKASRRLPW